MSKHPDCADNCDGDHILCRRCADETNHVPDDLPPEWDGYCPRCALELAYMEKTLPKADVRAVLPQLMRQVESMLSEKLGVTVGIVPVSDHMDVAIPDESGVTVITRQCMN